MELIAVGCGTFFTVLKVPGVPKEGDKITIEERQIVAQAKSNLFLGPGMTLTLISRAGTVDFQGKKIPSFGFECKLA